MIALKNFTSVLKKGTLLSRRNFALAAVCIGILPFPASAWQIEGSMRCKVMSNQVIDVKEGRPVHYGGIVDSFEVGDFLYLDYSRTGNCLSVSLIDKSKDPSIDVLIALAVKLNITDGDSLLTDMESSDHSGLGKDTIFFAENHILLVDRWGGQLQMNRYYKGDWHGVGSDTVNGSGLQVFTLDCRQVEDRIEDVISAPLID